MNVPDNTNITGEHLPNPPALQTTTPARIVQSCSLATVYDMKSGLLACAAAALEALQIPHGTVRLLFKTLNTKRSVQH